MHGNISKILTSVLHTGYCVNLKFWPSKQKLSNTFSSCGTRSHVYMSMSKMKILLSKDLQKYWNSSNLHLLYCSILECLLFLTRQIFFLGTFYHLCLVCWDNLLWNSAGNFVCLDQWTQVFHIYLWSTVLLTHWNMRK